VIVVLDTNIIVSAILNSDSSCGRILQLALDVALPAAYNSGMYAEYEDVLLRRKFWPVHEQSRIILERISQDWIQVRTKPLLIALPDPKDVPFLETAAAVRADALVTGNIRHFPINLRQGIAVLNPREFLEQLRHS